MGIVDWSCSSQLTSPKRPATSVPSPAFQPPHSEAPRQHLSTCSPFQDAVKIISAVSYKNDILVSAILQGIKDTLMCVRGVPKRVNVLTRLTLS